MGEVVTLPVIRIERSEGNGARDALIEIGKDCPFHVEEGIASNWADDVIMNLWMRGFKITPLEKTDALPE